MNYIATNIRYLRKRWGYSQETLAEMLGYTSSKSFTTVQKWESGVSTPPLIVFIQMAELFKVDLDDFAYTDLAAANSAGHGEHRSSSVPVYSRIPAGVPIDDVEDIEGYIEVESLADASGQDYFAMRITDDSMQPEYRYGDIVLFERQTACDNGADCAVRIGNNDATFRKVRNMPDFVVLQPINPDYEPSQISNAGDILIEILGVAREIRRKA